MQYSDDEMNELFQKASEEIRLSLGNDDWDLIHARLSPGTSIIPAMGFKKKQILTRQKMVITALIVMIIVGIAGIIFEHGRENKIIMSKQPVVPFLIQSSPEPKISSRGMRIKNAVGLLISRKAFREYGASLNDIFLYNGILTKASFSLNTVSQKNSNEPTAVLLNPNREAKLENITGKPDKTHAASTTSGRNRFYAGILAGPQFSQAEQQGFSQAGWSAGLIAGFRLIKRLNVETGLIVSSKIYSSPGQYFDMNKISASMPSGMKLMYVKSRSRVIEIPIKVKYSVIRTKRGDVFATGGISSFIISKENNQYQGLVNGNPVERSGSYSSPQNYFAGVVHISAGYEWRAGKNFKLRLEPYIQIPTKTMGMGSMQVLSTGIYLGITIPVIK